MCACACAKKFAWAHSMLSPEAFLENVDCFMSELRLSVCVICWDEIFMIRDSLKACVLRLGWLFKHILSEPFLSIATDRH